MYRDFPSVTFPLRREKLFFFTAVGKGLSQAWLPFSQKMPLCLLYRVVGVYHIHCVKCVNRAPSGGHCQHRPGACDCPFCGMLWMSFVRVTWLCKTYINASNSVFWCMEYCLLFILVSCCNLLLDYSSWMGIFYSAHKLLPNSCD